MRIELYAVEIDGIIKMHTKRASEAIDYAMELSTKFPNCKIRVCDATGSLEGAQNERERFAA